MTTGIQIKHLTAPDIRNRKQQGQDHTDQEHAAQQPIVCLTAYTTPMARILDRHVDILLVGDSLGMVVYGMDNTLGVSLDMMIRHGQAVVRGSARALVVVDMPFGSYQESPQQAFANCARVMAETGCGAVKMEGGAELADTISFLTQRGIPVMAHVGLTPQYIHALGGFKAQGKTANDAARILQDARIVEQAGAFAVVLEGVIETLARKITATIGIPTIGIGASPACDGQVLVVDDLLGMFTDFKPKFVERYAHLGQDIDQAVQRWADDVRTRRFPGAQHCFTAPVNQTPTSQFPQEPAEKIA